MPALLTNGSYTVSLPITGAAGVDTSYTRPTVSVGTFSSGNTTIVGAAGTFSTAGTLTQNLSLTFGSSTTGTQSVSIALTNTGISGASGLLHEEAGVTGASVTPNVSGSITFSTMVGQATPATQVTTASAATFNGNTLKAMVAAGATYANLSSFVNAGSGCLGTAATILSGTNSGSAVTIGMTWRPRASVDEIPGHTSGPAPKGGLISDVVQPSGFNSSDYVVLDMTYSAALLNEPAATAYADGALYMGKYAGAGNTWINAGSIREAFGSAAPAPSLATLGEYGANGTDMWVVVSGSALNGVNQFAVVPEPGTIALLLTGCLAAIPVIRRRLKKSKA